MKCAKKLRMIHCGFECSMLETTKGVAEKFGGEYLLSACRILNISVLRELSARASGQDGLPEPGSSECTAENGGRPSGFGK